MAQMAPEDGDDESLFPGYGLPDRHLGRVYLASRLGHFQAWVRQPARPPERGGLRGEVAACGGAR